MRLPHGVAAVLVAQLLALPAARSQDDMPVARKRFVQHTAPAHGRLELSYGLSDRSSDQSEASTTISSDGRAADRFRAGGAWFFGNRFGAGLSGDLVLSKFMLAGADFTGAPMSAKATEMRARGGLALRWVGFSGFSLESQLGYGLLQLPSFLINEESLDYHASKFQGPMVAALLGYAPAGGKLSVLARGAYLLPVATKLDPAFSSVTHFTAGAELGLGAFNLLGLRWMPVLGADFVSTQAEGEGRTLKQDTIQGELGLRMQVPNRQPIVVELPPPTGPGSLRGRVIFADTKQPAAGVTVVVAGTPVVTDAAGAFVAPKVGPGKVALQVQHKGYLPAQQSVLVPPEEEVIAQQLALEPRPPGPGRIKGRVLLGDGRDPKRSTPLADIRILLGETEAAISAADGTFVIEKAGPGPVSLAVNTKGYKPAEEVVSVPADGEAQLELTLHRTGTVLLATIKGMVRSVDGSPLRARLRIPEANIRTQTNPDGSFAVRLRGGRYTVTIQAKGYREQTKSVEVADGDQAIFNVEMHRKK